MKNRWQEKRLQVCGDNKSCIGPQYHFIQRCFINLHHIALNVKNWHLIGVWFELYQVTSLIGPSNLIVSLQRTKILINIT